MSERILRAAKFHDWVDGHHTPVARVRTMDLTPDGLELIGYRYHEWVAGHHTPVVRHSRPIATLSCHGCTMLAWPHLEWTYGPVYTGDHPCEAIIYADAIVAVPNIPYFDTFSTPNPGTQHCRWRREVTESVLLGTCAWGDVYRGNSWYELDVVRGANQITIQATRHVDYSFGIAASAIGWRTWELDHYPTCEDVSILLNGAIDLTASYNFGGIGTCSYFPYYCTIGQWATFSCSLTLLP